MAGSTGWLAAWGVGLRRQPYTDAQAPHLPRTHRRKSFYHGNKLNSAFLSKYWRNTEEKDIPWTFLQLLGAFLQGNGSKALCPHRHTRPWILSSHQTSSRRILSLLLLLLLFNIILRKPHRWIGRRHPYSGVYNMTHRLPSLCVMSPAQLQQLGAGMRVGKGPGGWQGARGQAQDAALPLCAAGHRDQLTSFQRCLGLKLTFTCSCPPLTGHLRGLRRLCPCLAQHQPSPCREPASAPPWRKAMAFSCEGRRRWRWASSVASCHTSCLSGFFLSFLRTGEHGTSSWALWTMSVGERLVPLSLTPFYARHL